MPASPAQSSNDLSSASTRQGGPVSPTQSNINSSQGGPVSPTQSNINSSQGGPASPLFIGTGKPPPQTTGTDPSSPPEYITELERVTKEMYKQNYELAVKNKTLNVIRILSGIAMSPFDPAEVAQLIVNTIINELNFAVSIISVVDKEKAVIQHLAISQTSETIRALRILNKPLYYTQIPLATHHNALVLAIQSQSHASSAHIFELLTPSVTEETATKFQEAVGVKDILIYPFVYEHTLGALTIGLTNPSGELSKAERETLDQIKSIIGLALDRAIILDSLKKANIKLQKLDELKDEFLSVASHDLRTPVTAIKGYLWLMLRNKENLTDKQRDQLTRIYNSSERMIALINDMLDVSRIEGGRMQMVFETIDIVYVAKDVQQELAGQAAEKRIQIFVNEGTFLAKTDRNRLHEILVNLIGNAIKFTPEGGKITLSYYEQYGYVVTNVTDTGIGISQENMRLLFTKFGRIDTSFSSIAQVPGTGLGLYICKKIVEMSGGEISAKSEIGKGTTITFTLQKAES